MLHGKLVITACRNVRFALVVSQCYTAHLSGAIGNGSPNLQPNQPTLPYPVVASNEVLAVDGTAAIAVTNVNRLVLLLWVGRYTYGLQLACLL
jgi:hypothetical protein